MPADKISKRRQSTASLVIPAAQDDRRVSLTGYTNIILDPKNPDALDGKTPPEPVRVRFADLPTASSEIGFDKPIKRKYYEALQTLKPFRPSSKDGKLPINKVGLFSYALVSWFTPVVWKMYKNRDQPVAEKDIWQCSDEEGLELNSQRLEKIWLKELQDKGEEKASVFRCWMKFTKTRSIVNVLLVTISTVSSFLGGAFLLNIFISYLESEEDNMSYGLTLAGIMLLLDIVRTVTFATMQVFASQTASRFRSAFMGIMYRKMMTLRALKGSTNSEILTVFSVDSYRVFFATASWFYLLCLPLFLLIATVYSYVLIGYWGFIGIAAFGVCYVTQIQLTKTLKMLRKKTVKYTDQRVRRMTEVLGNMKFIKMYAWESPFTTAIQGIRKMEKKYVMISNIVNSITLAVIPAAPTIASIITISAYSAAGNELRASKVFAIIGTMDFLRVIVALLPFAMKVVEEAKVSFKRLQKLLLVPELQPISDEVFDKTNAVEIKSGSFLWELVPDITSVGKKKKKEKDKNQRRESVNLFALNDINLDVRKGELVGICGQVGAGKSSLISVIMNRMLKTRGHLAVDGTVAYVAQQAWIFNASVKDNILFGLPYHEQRYRRVIECCGLEPDLKMFTDGDETEIGERGTNLSGGQKQRVNLARAVYSNSDIYLLDDPLSALDVKVSKEIFHKCIQGELSGKTIILATHQLQYLKHCDKIVVMEDGAIVEIGLHDELIAADSKYTEMMRVFDKTTMKSNAKKKTLGDGEPKAEEEEQSDSSEKSDKKDANGAPATNGVANGVAKPKKKEKMKLVLTEEMAVGTISFDTYRTYIKAAGGWCVALFAMLLCIIATGAQVFADFWLSIWINGLPVPSVSNETVLSNVTTMMPSNVSDVSTGIATTIAAVAQYTSVPLAEDTNLHIYAATLLAVIMLTIITGVAIAKTTITASSRLHSMCLDKVMKATMTFFDSNPDGRVLNRFTKDLDECDVFIPQIVTFSMRLITSLFLSIGLAAYITPWILIGMIPLTIAFYVMRKISAVTIRQMKRLENVARSPLISHVNTTLQGLPTIVAYGQQQHFINSCNNYGDVATMTALLFEASMRWVGVRLDLVASLVTFSAGVIFVMSKGTIPPASAALVLSLCGKNLKMVQFLLRVINEAEARFTSVERLHDYAKNLESERQTAKKMAAEKWPEHGAVSFKNVVMRYRPGLDPVLKDINFDILPREKVGIVGRTGAGKSSLAAVLFRLIELSDGSINVDGENIADLHLNALRNKLSTITQDPVLFAETIRYNVDPFSLYTDDDIWRALENVHLKEKLQQSTEGLEAMVDENGQNFSVGERQLLCLARALLRKSKILLLDEATANIDTSTDALIQQTIQECFADCTVITIAHRLNTVLHCNKIIVLDAGKVMECASPQDLLSDPYSFFNSMIAAQTVKTPTPIPQ